MTAIETFLSKLKYDKEYARKILYADPYTDEQGEWNFFAVCIANGRRDFTSLKGASMYYQRMEFFDFIDGNGYKVLREEESNLATNTTVIPWG